MIKFLFDGVFFTHAIKKTPFSDLLFIGKKPSRALVSGVRGLFIVLCINNIKYLQMFS